MFDDEIIVSIYYGSHLYGTTTAESDTDIKGIYLPKARDILLQRVAPVISRSPQKAPGQANLATDIDYELYSPEKYLTMLAKGQSVALEMLFAPDSAILGTPHPVWQAIKELAPTLLTKQAVSFVRYCTQQANKYCIKGAKLAAAREVLAVLQQGKSEYGAAAKLSNLADTLHTLSKQNPQIVIKPIAQATGTHETFLELCGKKASFNASIESAIITVEHIIEEYGKRAQAAEEQNGIDWKALMHAVRVSNQAIEFLTDHTMTFPRPEAEHLLAIRQGKIAYEQVIEEIEQQLCEVKTAAAKSTLPETYNPQIIDDFIEQLYREQICKEQRAMSTVID